MDVGTIIAIAVAVIVVIALIAFAIPRARRARERRALEQRRDAVVDRHRQESQLRQSRAEIAEQRAARERAEAELHESRARLHERGLADDELREADSPDEVVQRRETFADRESPAGERGGTERDRVQR
jgi:flagellar biosynthesis/type III secretory pathway M-ring protein FliF/YscJ